MEHEKATKLRSPNFHVSTTRLAVHNIPKDMSEKDLKKLFITAVKSRASKQQPVIKQVLTLWIRTYLEDSSAMWMIVWSLKSMQNRVVCVVFLFGGHNVFMYVSDVKFSTALYA